MKVEEPVVNRYINGAEFRKEIVKQKLIADANPGAAISDELGQYFLSIATNLSSHRNFVRYTYKEEMVGDAVECCLRYWKCYDINRQSSAFSYFTQVCWWSFIRRIKSETKQADIKETLMENSDLFNDMTETQDLDCRTYANMQLSKIQHEFQKDRKAKRAEKEKIKKVKEKGPIGLEAFMV